MHFVSGRGDRCARLQHRDDTGNRVVLGGRWQRDDRFAVFGLLRSSKEILLSADAGEHLVSDGIRDNLSHQVNFNRGIDRYYVVILRDDTDIVRVIYRHQLNHRIVIHEFI